MVMFVWPAAAAVAQYILRFISSVKGDGGAGAAHLRAYTSGLAGGFHRLAVFLSCLLTDRCIDGVYFFIFAFSGGISCHRREDFDRSSGIALDGRAGVFLILLAHGWFSGSEEQTGLNWMVLMAFLVGLLVAEFEALRSLVLPVLNEG